MPDHTNGSGGVPERDTATPVDVNLGPLLTRQEVLARTTLSASQVDVMLREGIFPKFVRPGGPGTRRLALPEALLDGWFESIIELRDSKRRLGDPVTLPKWTPRLPSGDLPPGLRVLRLPDVERSVTYSRNRIYSLMGAGRFPWPIPISVRCRGWLLCEVEDWKRRGQREIYGEPIRWRAGTRLRDAERGDRPDDR